MWLRLKELATQSCEYVNVFEDETGQVRLPTEVLSNIRVDSVNRHQMGDYGTQTGGYYLYYLDGYSQGLTTDFVKGGEITYDGVKYVIQAIEKLNLRGFSHYEVLMW